MAANLDRRELLKLFSAAAFTTLQLPAAVPDAPLFFTQNEFAALDILTELIVPADEHSPGAHAAGVAAFIDRTVAESFLPEDKSSWRTGLASIDALSQSMYQAPFLSTGHEQQIALLTNIAKNERHPETEPEKFFTQLKQTTAFAYYSSSIGIHHDIQYKGNVALQQFAGYDAT